ncbi:MAG: YIP1 family protein [Methanomicrobiaceae archaeon]|nr:YIP1 family protein [Methanomicrobiaceae archaeon]
MINEIFQKFKDITLNPVETFRKSRDEELGTSFIYFLVVIAVYCILSGIVSMLFIGIFSSFMPGMSTGMIAGSSIMFGIISIITSFIFSVIALIVGAVILHIFVYILGGRKGIEQTIKASIYSCTPLAILGWIPVVSLIAIVWSFILEALAVRELHEISTARAVIAVLIPLIIFIGIIVVAFILFFTIMASEGPVMMNEMTV